MAKNDEKKAGIFQWIIVIILPLIFAIVLTVIILSIAGVDVVNKTKNYANHVPFLSSVVTTEVEKSHDDEMEALKATIKEKEIEVNQLTAQIQDRDAMIEDLNTEITNLTSRLASQTEVNQENETMIKDIAASFIDMETVSAAQILSNLEEDLAVEILHTISNEDRGQILSQMAPDIAATLTSGLMQDN